jgi:hypothetical protein
MVQDIAVYYEACDTVCASNVCTVTEPYFKQIGSNTCVDSCSPNYADFTTKTCVADCPLGYTEGTAVCNQF